MAQRASRKTSGLLGDDERVLAVIWLVLAIVWFVIVIAAAFLLGGLAVALPFFSGLKEWSKTITLYDLFSGIGYYYAVLMATIGATFIVAVAKTHPDEIHEAVIGISLLGAIVLLLLIAGKLIS